MSTYSQKKSKRLAEINMTPFVDIMLVLLIIFIVCTPVIYSSFNVSIPSASFANKHSIDSIKIELFKDGKISIEFAKQNKHNFKNIDDFKMNLTKLNFDKSLNIYIIADEECKYVNVIRLVDVVSSLGFSNISFVAKS